MTHYNNKYNKLNNNTALYGKWLTPKTMLN